MFSEPNPIGTIQFINGGGTPDLGVCRLLVRDDGCPVFQGVLKRGDVEFESNIHFQESKTIIRLQESEESPSISLSPRQRLVSPRFSSSSHRYRSPNQYSQHMSRFLEFLKSSSPSLSSLSDNPAEWESSPRYITSTSIAVILLEPWGSGNYIGLTGLEVVTLNQQKLSLTTGQILVFPRELMNVGWKGMVGNFGALFDGVNQTTDVNHMWLVPAVINGKHPMIQIRFPVLTPICGIRVFNFNSNSIESFHGAKLIQIVCNGSVIGVPFHDCFPILRRTRSSSFARRRAFRSSTTRSTSR